jgi:hypothetical protein
MDEITINDIGTDLQITIEDTDIVVDVSSATALAIVLKSPAGLETEKVASNITDGTDGGIHYQTLAGDIDETGIWTYRGKVTFAAGRVFHTTRPRSFRVGL